MSERRENAIWNQYVKRIEAHRRRERHQAWLEAHPGASWGIAILGAAVIFLAAMFVKWLLLGCVSCEPLNR